ncbi:ROK family protein [Candidatus Saccharibacteria bacterium]|nr:ROK family protein [Candidatus Saccharibacteria bacterium]
MILAIDIGGTKTSIATFSELLGFPLKSKSIKFPTPDDCTNIELEFNTAIQKLIPDPTNRSKIQIAVIAYPGLVQEGLPTSAPNLPAWNDFDLVECIKNVFTANGIACPFYFENDANLGAFYECRNKKGRAIYLTFSTGIGGGIMENNQLSPASASFEPGHMTFTYNGQVSPWEDFASVKAINAANNVDDIKKVTAPRALFDVASRLSLGITQIIREQQPTTVIIGGPIGLIYRNFQKQLKTIIAPSLNNTIPAKILPAKKPMECVEYGCYYYAKAILKATKS